MLGYLLYNMVQSTHTIEPSFYQILGVSLNTDKTELKLAFMQFEAKPPWLPGNQKGWGGKVHDG